MAAGDFRGAGSATVVATGPGAKASLEVTVSGLLTTDVILLTPVNTSEEDLGSRNKPITYQIVKEAGKFTIYFEQEQTLAIKFDYLAIVNA